MLDKRKESPKDTQLPPSMEPVILGVLLMCCQSSIYRETEVWKGK